MRHTLTGVLCYFIVLLASLPLSFLVAQHADVEGDMRIRGHVDLHADDDTTYLSIGYKSGKQAGPWSTFVGVRSGTNNIRSGCTYIGYEAGFSNVDGLTGTFIGHQAGRDNVSGDRNCLMGYQAAFSNISGSRTVAIGYQVALRDTFADKSVYLGFEAGSTWPDFSNRTGNIFIGHQAGKDNMESNRLFIENSDAEFDEALIYGEFDNDYLRINGELEIGGSGNQSRIVLQNDGQIRFNQSSSGPFPTLSLASDDHTYMNSPKDLIFQTGYKEWMRIQASGDVTFQALDGVGLADLQVDANGTLVRSMSDRRLKENIKPISNALHKILALRGVRYHWKENPVDTSFGVIAQEVQEVLPEIITSDGEFLGVNYSEISAVLIEAIKEQQGIIESLQVENSKLLERLIRLEAAMVK